MRVLVWAGAPVPAFHPTRKEVREGVQTLTRDTRIRCETDPREHPFHCHHEKTVVVDGELAFVGGIDMTDYAGDRFDTSDHPARRRLGWHDVGTRLRGPAVADVDDHFALRWRELTGEQLDRPPAPAHAGEHTVQVVRTIANGMYDAVPDGEYRILESYVRAIARAERFIYLENQFLWSPEISRLLADKLRHPPCDEFRIVIVLPAKANNGQDDTLGQLGVLAVADDGAGRLLAATLRSRTGERVDRLYVHAKVGIVDDRWLTVGSANLNAHSLLNDTEMNVVTDDPDLARATRLRLWAEHLEVDVIGDRRRRAAHGRRRPLARDRVRAARAAARRGAGDAPAAGPPRPLAALAEVARAARRPSRRRLTQAQAGRRPFSRTHWPTSPRRCATNRSCSCAGYVARTVSSSSRSKSLESTQSSTSSSTWPRRLSQKSW